MQTSANLLLPLGSTRPYKLELLQKAALRTQWVGSGHDPKNLHSVVGFLQELSPNRACALMYRMGGVTQFKGFMPW